MNNILRNARKVVLVRSWGDKPVKLCLHRIENKICYVGQELSDRPIGFPLEDVFTYDDALFERLEAAYSERDSHLLHRLYQQCVERFPLQYVSK